MSKKESINVVQDADNGSWRIINILVKIKQVKILFIAFVKNAEMIKLLILDNFQ